MFYNNVWRGQSFKPTVTLLTRVQLVLKKLNTPPPSVTLSIRNNLNGSDLVSVKNTSKITTTNSWVEFDIPDLIVTPGTTYYLVVRTSTSAGDISNCYYWGYGSGTLYTDGRYHTSMNSGIPGSWTHNTNYDFSFKIYGA